MAINSSRAMETLSRSWSRVSSAMGGGGFDLDILGKVY